MFLRWSRARDSDAYKNNGAIVIWWDETEGGDGLTRTIPELIISPLAKGNAYASSVELNHSSDLKTLEELFGLPFLNNVIPSAETSATGTGYHNVATANVLSDLFVAGAIPGPRSFEVTREPAQSNPQSHAVSQVVHIANSGTSAAPAPLFLVLDHLPSGVTLQNGEGATATLAPIGSPFVAIDVGGDDVLRPHETKTVNFQFDDPSDVAVTFDARVLAVTPAP